MLMRRRYQCFLEGKSSFFSFVLRLFYASSAVVILTLPRNENMLAIAPSSLISSP